MTNHIKMLGDMARTGHTSSKNIPSRKSSLRQLIKRQVQEEASVSAQGILEDAEMEQYYFEDGWGALPQNSRLASWLANNSTGQHHPIIYSANARWDNIDLRICDTCSTPEGKLIPSRQCAVAATYLYETHNEIDIDNI